MAVSGCRDGGGGAEIPASEAQGDTINVLLGVVLVIVIIIFRVKELFNEGACVEDYACGSVV